MSNGYLGNSYLKRSAEAIEYTPEQIKEFMKCAKDPIYFAKKYIKIVHVDRGLVPFDMYDYQKEILGFKVWNGYGRTGNPTEKFLNINNVEVGELKI